MLYPSFTIYNFARRGKVLPVFNQFGKFFGTYRIFGQYAVCLILPYGIFMNNLEGNYINHVKQLWRIHANRLNCK
jgi:hypothetical protein